MSSATHNRRVNGTCPLSVFGVVETALRSTAAAKKAGTWYLGVIEAAERTMARWHEHDAELSRQRGASAGGGAQENGERGGNRRSVEGNPTKGMRGGWGTGRRVEGRLRWTKVGMRWPTG